MTKKKTEIVEMSEEALKAILDKHAAYLKTRKDGDPNDVISKDFRNVVFGLENADLRYADLRHSKFSNANDNHLTYLCNIKLTGSNLDDVDLSWIDLTGADFSDTHLDNTNFTYANLTNATFSKACINHTNFTKSRLIGTTFNDTMFGFFTIFKGATLSNVDLHGASLNSADFSGADLSHANLVGARLDTDLSNANLDGVDARYADFNYANLTNAYCAKSNFSNAKFEGARLEHTNFNSANLTNAYFAGAYLNGATLCNAILNMADFTRSDLSNADLTNTTLALNNLVDVNLEGATLVNVKYYIEPISGKEKDKKEIAVDHQCGCCKFAKPADNRNAA